MSKTLRRPMFKMGGNADSGIVSGFGRKKYDKGTQEEDDYIANYSQATQQQLSDLDQYGSELFPEQAPEHAQPGWGMSEWLALTKLGANIASAPNRGKGFANFAAATGPAFGQFADDIDVLNREKMNRAAEYDATRKEALLKLAGTRAQIGAEALGAELGAEVERASTAAQIQSSEKVAKWELETNFRIAAEDRLEVEAVLQDSITLENIIMGSDPDGSPEEANRHESAKSKLRKINETKSAVKDKMKADLIASEMLQVAAEDMSRLDDDQREDRFQGMNKDQIAAKMAQDQIDLLFPASEMLYVPEYNPDFVLSPEDLAWWNAGGQSPTPELSFSRGGRVGRYAGGAMAMGDEGVDATGPMEPGPNPDPNQPPIMQASAPGPVQASPIGFEELRARLPREVSDEVVRLLAASEEALLDFAQIQTQDDIARFNQKYNADLVLPSQNQVV